MATHKVCLTLPPVELGKMNAIFDIHKDGTKLGTITISKGTIEWYPSNAKKPIEINWTKFDKMMKDSHNK